MGLAAFCLLVFVSFAQSCLAYVSPESSLPDAPSFVKSEREKPIAVPTEFSVQSASASLPSSAPDQVESFHWNGLILESLAFNFLQNGVRVMTASQKDRHLLLNKPYWSDYWASLGEFNWRRWNDGDNFAVNYVGHPMEGAIAGYIEVQNNPRDRVVKLGNNRAYWYSRLRAFGWAAVYSTQWELGPLGESAIFNQGGFTYPIRCKKSECNANSQYTNNTGWVDLVVTPVVGTLWLIGEDAIDAWITDPLVRRHPHNFGFLVLRAGANPSRSLANMLRGRYPWYRDEEHPMSRQSGVATKFNEAIAKVPEERFDIYLHFSDFSLRTNRPDCHGCRRWVRGGGAGMGIRLFRYLDATTDFSVMPDASPESSLNIGGTLVSGTFGLRSGYNGKHFALKAGLAPGFASYSDALDYPSGATSNPSLHRATNFQCVASIAGDVKIAPHFGARITVQNMLIRYKSEQRDPEGIGTPPRLSFLSHDNFINSTNWGVEVGPVFRF